MTKRLRRIADYVLARLSEASTVRALIRLVGLALFGAANDPERGIYAAGAAVLLAELVGAAFPDRIRRGRKLRGDDDGKNP